MLKTMDIVIVAETSSQPSHSSHYVLQEPKECVLATPEFGDLYIYVYIFKFIDTKLLLIAACIGQVKIPSIILALILMFYYHRGIKLFFMNSSLYVSLSSKVNKEEKNMVIIDLAVIRATFAIDYF